MSSNPLRRSKFFFVLISKKKTKIIFIIKKNEWKKERGDLSKEASIFEK